MDDEAASEDSPVQRFRRVAAGFDDVAAAVGSTQWTNQAPCDGWQAIDVVRHLVGWIPSMLGSVGVQAPGSVDDDPVGSWRAVRDSLQAAIDDPVRGATPIAFGPAGTHPLRQAVDRFVTPDVLVHTWDLARAIGIDAELDQRVSADVLGGLEMMGDMLVASGHFAPRVAVAADADVQTRLLGASGRDPSWEPTVSD